MSQDEIQELFIKNGNRPLTPNDIKKILNKSNSGTSTCLAKMLKHKDLKIVRVPMEYPSGMNRSIIIKRMVNAYQLDDEYSKSLFKNTTR